MTFWVLAGIIAVLAAVLLCWPLLRSGSGLPGVGPILALLIPVTALLLYQGVGAPDGIGVGVSPVATEQMPSGAADFEQLVAELEARLLAQPDDLQGWMLLGRSYKSVQQFDKALVALEKARALAPDDPYVSVELAEAMIFTSQTREIDPEIRQLLSTALAQEPTLQKALWLLGIVESQAGNDTLALEHWAQLLPMLEAGSGVANSVQEQINQARSRLGLEADTGWAGLQVTIEGAATQTTPDGAVLFIIARDPQAPRPPLGAKRIPLPEFPVTVRLTNQDSMMPQRPISGVNEIEVLARLSLSGDPVAAPGDWHSEIIQLNLDANAPVILQLQTP